MRTPRIHRQYRAFTALEMLVVISVVCILVVLFGFALKQAQTKARHIKCARHLKSTALCFKMFAGDNTGVFPAGITNSLAYQNGQQAWTHFQMLSNELGSVKILACPADASRVKAMALTFDTASNGLITMQNRAVSYFVNADAHETNNTMVLLGDRNLVIGGQSFANTGLTLPGSTLLQWDRGIHGSCGNVALADGSVHSLVPTYSLWTNHNDPVRLAIP